MSASLEWRCCSAAFTKQLDVIEFTTDAINALVRALWGDLAVGEQDVHAGGINPPAYEPFE